MVDIQSVAAGDWARNKKKKERRKIEDRKKLQGKKYNAPYYIGRP